MKKPILLTVALFTSFFSFAQILNADFEDWYIDTSGYKKLTSWEHLSKTDLVASGSGPLWGTRQDNNSEHGSYALMLSRWYSYAWDNIRQRTAISSRPAQLTGYYKYTKTALLGAKTDDTAAVDIYMTVWNSSLGKPDTIGTGRRKLSSANVYTAFTCDINYTGSTIPDTIQIHIEPSIFRGIGADCADSNYCSFLSVDNLVLHDNTSVPTVEKEVISIFPNPSYNTLNIIAENKIERIRIIDMLGRIMLEKSYDKPDKITLNISFLLPGNYIITVNKHYVYRIVKRP